MDVHSSHLAARPGSLQLSRRRSLERRWQDHGVDGEVGAQTISLAAFDKARTPPWKAPNGSHELAQHQPIVNMHSRYMAASALHSPAYGEHDRWTAKDVVGYVEQLRTQQKLLPKEIDTTYIPRHLRATSPKLWTSAVFVTNQAKIGSSRIVYLPRSRDLRT
jgi:hypothetical protein